ncbi:LAFE_0D06524g1_1 [Lachancea fermentati]|uniref:LAFE_0D06524g1_1 n=1 Tax=Lachancea fermentati TaxID=4955 RepID=A0A1G4MBG5_LACFM|nr:LAFE_0D06524g1_1 [Lachancea fermentati]
MIRRQPSTINLTQEDVLELQDELEEQKLQTQIRSQQRNLQRSGTIPESFSEQRPDTKTDSTSLSGTPLDKNIADDNSQRRPSHASIDAESRSPAQISRAIPNNPFYTG